MDYCAPRGIPHSIFLGRTPADGESDWLEADRDKALWWQLRENQRCSSCGTHPDDWNPDLGGRRDAYYADERTCPGCQRHDAKAEDLERARRQGEPKHGAKVVLFPTPYEDEEFPDG